MANLNSVFLMGNLTRDPELKYAGNGTPVCSFGLAVNRKYGQDGDKEEVLFVDITAFGRQAETCNEYLSKGRCAFVDGRLKLDQWTNDSGEKRSKINVIANRVQFIGGRDDGGGTRPAETPRPERVTAPAPAADDDIPF